MSGLHDKITMTQGCSRTLCLGESVRNLRVTKVSFVQYPQFYLALAQAATKRGYPEKLGSYQENAALHKDFF